MFNSYEHLREQIRAHGLGEIEERIVQVAKPSIRIEPTPANDDDLPIGASKFYGNPDLPPGFQWPYWSDLPMIFGMQLRLSDVAIAWGAENNPLPSEGWLYFFFGDTYYLESEEKDWQIYYVPNEKQPLKRLIQPEPDKKKHPHSKKIVLSPQCIKFSKKLSLADYMPRFITPSIYETLYQGMSPAEIRVTWESFSTLLRTNYPRPCYQLLGHARPPRRPVEYDCVIVTHQLQKDVSVAQQRTEYQSRD